MLFAYAMQKSRLQQIRSPDKNLMSSKGRGVLVNGAALVLYVPFEHQRKSEYKVFLISNFTEVAHPEMFCCVAYHWEVFSSNKWNLSSISSWRIPKILLSAWGFWTQCFGSWACARRRLDGWRCPRCWNDSSGPLRVGWCLIERKKTVSADVALAVQG